MPTSRVERSAAQAHGEAVDLLDRNDRKQLLARVQPSHVEIPRRHHDLTARHCPTGLGQLVRPLSSRMSPRRLIQQRRL